MKLIIMLYFLLIIMSLTNLVFSYTGRKTRVFNVVPKSVSKTDDVRLFDDMNDKDTSSLTSLPSDEQSKSTGRQEEMNIEVRDSWDSGEDRYFKWASLNRRPMESLSGRKRTVEEEVPRTESQRQRIWRSRLFGYKKE